jgi:hypothetical protein
VDAILPDSVAPSVVAGAAILFGVVVLVLAIRALTNAAVALRARLFALGSGAALLGVGAGRPLGWDVALGEMLAGWLDTPLEQAALIGLAALVLGLLVGLVLLYFWIRALMRMAWLAFVGLTLLAVSVSVILAGEGILPVPDVLRDSFVLGAITGMLLVLWGVVRMLQQAVQPAPAKAR